MPYSGLHAQINSHLEAHLPTYLTHLQQMVSINSYTTNPLGVNALAQVTADLFDSLGFTPEYIPSVYEGYGNHLILTRQGQGADANHPKPTIGLVSHLDTVFSPEEEVVNNFHWHQEGDRIYGPGTVDIKGGTIIIYMMMHALHQLCPDLFNTVTWVILIDASEEAEAEDFGQICRDRLAEARACLIFEGGNMHRNHFKVVTVRKGMAIYHITVEGKASHAGSAHQNGASAITQMADVIKRIHNFTDYERDITFNVGKITGGTVTNRIPHHAEALVEMRAFSLDIYNEGVANMLALNNLSTVSSANGEFPCQVKVEITRRTPPWPQNEPTESLYQIWHEAGEALGFKIIREERGGLSDGNHFWHVVPTLDGLGPSGGNAHCSERSPDRSKDQEFVLMSSFVPKALLNITAVLHLLGHLPR